MGPLTPHVFAGGGDEDTDTLDKRVSSLGVVGSWFSRGQLLALWQSWLISEVNLNLHVGVDRVSLTSNSTSTVCNAGPLACSRITSSQGYCI